MYVLVLYVLLCQNKNNNQIIEGGRAHDRSVGIRGSQCIHMLRALLRNTLVEQLRSYVASY
jgi:hypothetical protein